MKAATFFDTRIEVDETATARWYEHAEEWDCGCADCRNYLAAAKARRLPAPLLHFLDTYGIPPEKAFYVCRIPLDSGSDRPERACRYQLNFRLCGRILQQPEPGAHADMSFSEQEPEPFYEPGFPEPHFDLCAFCTLPRMPGESPDGNE